MVSLKWGKKQGTLIMQKSIQASPAKSENRKSMNSKCEYSGKTKLFRGQLIKGNDAGRVVPAASAWMVWVCMA